MVSKQQAPQVIVTGGAGFVGQHLSRRLVKNGYRVAILDDCSTGTVPQDLLRDTEYCSFFWDDASTVLQVAHKFFKNSACIYYVNGPSSSPMYKKDPLLVGKTVNGFIQHLEVAKEYQCKLIYASTSSLYNGNPLPWDESMEIQPVDFYSEVRFYMERLAHIYHDLYNVRSIGLRQFSVYGPGEDGKRQYANLISQAIWAAEQHKPFEVYGDGNQLRDYTYIDDVVEAYWKAMQSTVSYGVYNIGTGSTLSVNQMLGVLKRAGVDVTVQYVKNPIQNYVPGTQANTRLALQELGFHARIGLEEGVRRILEARRTHGTACG